MMENPQPQQRPVEPGSEVDPALLREVETEETDRFQKWQSDQMVAYLNSRVVELAVENKELRKKVCELAAAVVTVEAASAEPEESQNVPVAP